MTNKSYEYSGPSDTPEVILTHKYQVLLANDAANMYYADKVTSETSAGLKCPDWNLLLNLSERPYYLFLRTWAVT